MEKNISNRRSFDTLGGSRAWLMWSVAEIFTLFQFSLQLSSGAMVNGLMQSFALNAFSCGILSSAYYYIYVTLQTPAGMLLDRFGPRRLLSYGAAVCGVGCLVFSQAECLSWAVVGRLFMGGGAAFAFVGSLTIVVRWFSAQQFTFMVGIVESFGMISSMVGGMYVALIIEQVGWRNCMFWAGVFALVIAVLLHLLFQDTPNLAESSSGDSSQKEDSVSEIHFLKGLKTLLSNPHAWANAVYSGLAFSVLTVFAALWGIPFLQLQHNLSLSSAAVLANLMFLGVALGCPLMGYLDNRWARRRSILAFCSLLSALCLTAIIFASQLPLPFLVALILLTGLCSSSYVITFTVGKEIVDPHIRSTGMGFVNTWSVIMAPLLQPVVGLIMHLSAKPELERGMHYTLMNYQCALSVLILAQLLALFLAFFIPSRQQSL